MKLILFASVNTCTCVQPYVCVLREFINFVSMLNYELLVVLTDNIKIVKSVIWIQKNKREISLQFCAIFEFFYITCLHRSPTISASIPHQNR